MNAVDFIIIGVVAVSLVFGLYKGFISSVFSLLAFFLSLIIAYSTYPQLARYLQENETLTRTLVNYTDSASRIHDLELSLTPVSGITPEALNEVLERAQLPSPIDEFVRENVAGQVFSAIGSTNISEYVNQTIVSVSINILCFLACFIIAYIVLLLLIHMISYVFRLPVLKHFDLLLGGAFGLVRGIFIVFVLFALVPIILTISPIEQVSTMIEQSRFADVFYRNNFITSIIQGTWM